MIHISNIPQNDKINSIDSLNYKLVMHLDIGINYSKHSKGKNQLSLYQFSFESNILGVDATLLLKETIHRNLNYPKSKHCALYFLKAFYYTL